MATRPVKCPYDEYPGFRFNKGFLVLDNGNTNYPEKIIKFDEKNKTYYFGDSTKVNDPDSVGNLLTVSELDSMVSITGRFDFAKGLNSPKMPQFTVNTVGEISFT